MDVDEFQKLWFDKLEGLLKDTPQEKLLTDLFGILSSLIDTYYANFQF